MVTYPALFIGHGSPQNLIHDNPFTRDLVALRGRLPRPMAIVLISAHWNTHGTLFTGSPRPEQIFDFYGFPQKLYDVKYDPSGEPSLANELAAALRSYHSSSSLQWGIDHAATIPLVHLFPKADIPVVEMSIDVQLPPERHYEMGKVLGGFRDKGILFIGSGNLIHDFREIVARWDADPLPWAAEFNEYLKEKLLGREHDALVHFERNPLSRKAFLTLEHYLPSLPVLGMMRDDERMEIVHQGIQHGSISHLSFMIGETIG